MAERKYLHNKVTELNNIKWGLLGPEYLSSTRRIQNLNLGAAVRYFNDLAVPGLGGVWYGKQLLLAALGVAVAEEARKRGAKVQNIEVANAIEALACMLAYKNNGWQGDSRLKGVSMLCGKTDFCFQKVRQKGFYVTQPMRMATVQALPALGFVEANSTRFNAFSCTQASRNFIEAATDEYRPYNRTVFEHLVQWVLMRDARVESSVLGHALSPLNALSSEAVKLLDERLIQGGNELSVDTARRQNALSWAKTIQKNGKKVTWEQPPKEITPEHWRDIKAGALFFKARQAALTALNAAEAYIANQADGKSFSLQHPVPEAITEPLEIIKTTAAAYLSEFSELNQDVKDFCTECARNDLPSILRDLVKRDGRVLCLVGDDIKPGPAFSGKALEEHGKEEDSQSIENRLFPADISYRIKNLYLLNLDMQDDLGKWLGNHSNRRVV